MISNFDNLFEQLLTALQTAEKRHRAVRDNASDNSDWHTYDSEGELISSIIKWRRSLEPLQAEIVASGAVSDDDVAIQHISFFDSAVETITQAETPKGFNEEEVKVGKYIRGKLRDLSKSGFSFSMEQIHQLCDVGWSRKMFTYPLLLPFAKIANIQQALSVQTKDENGKNRYWNEIFTFGDKNLLIISQWYAKDKVSFDKWYDNLTPLRPTTATDTLIFEKTVDWSTLNYGITIPVANWEMFFNAIGHTVNAGDSCSISIDIEDNESGVYKASVIHSVNGLTNAVQIRYSKVSGFVEKLRNIFKSTFDYCKHERGLNGENMRVFVPTDIEERISILATGTPHLLKFVCKPRTSQQYENDKTVDKPSVQDIYTFDAPSAKEKPTKITLFGKEYPVKAWNDMFVKVCEVMLLHQPYTMAAMDKDKEFNTDQRIHFSYIQSEIKFRGKRLSNGLWIETNENSGWTLNACRRLLEKCGFSPDEIQVETLEVK